MFQLTKEEFEDLRFQIETSNSEGPLKLQNETSKKGRGGHQVSALCIHRAGCCNA